MGAMRSPTSRLSLDQRLSKAPEIQELVFQLLVDLLEAIEDLSNIVKGESENRDTACDIAVDNEGNAQIVPSNDQDTSPEPSDEASMLLTIISSCITSLFRTGILIRKARTTDRFNSALQKSIATFHPEFDIDYVREKYPKLKGRGEATSGLSERLGKAMSKRRQFIKYSRDHQARLAYEELVEAPEDLLTRTEQLSSQATSLHPDRLPAPSLLPTTINEEDNEVEEDLVSMMSASTFSGPASILKLPTLEKLSPNGDAFECPICFTLQSFRREKAWRIHAFRDLKAYVCTVGCKDCESELFGDRNSWFQHEMQRHRAEYTCVLCTEGPFGVQSGLESHISATHGPFTQEQLRKLQIAGRQTPTLFRARDCPFCDDWAENIRGMADPKGKRPAQGNRDSDVFVSATRFKRHVAVHQEQLAIFAIPRAVEESGTPESGSIGSMSAAKSLRSVDSQEAFDSDPPGLGSAHEQHDVHSAGDRHNDFTYDGDDLSDDFMTAKAYTEDAMAPLAATSRRAHRNIRLHQTRFQMRILENSLHMVKCGKCEKCAGEKKATLESASEIESKAADLRLVLSMSIFKESDEMQEYLPEISRLLDEAEQYLTDIQLADSSRDPQPGASAKEGQTTRTREEESTTRHPSMTDNGLARTDKDAGSYSDFITGPDPNRPFTRPPEKLRNALFQCVFKFAGCGSTFSRKNDWKLHAIVEHIVSYYWICKDVQCVKTNPRTAGRVFHNKARYTSHVELVHKPVEYRKQAQRPEQSVPWISALRIMQETAERRRCLMPTYLQCPGQCSESFTGPHAWDDRMEHVANHVEESRDPSEREGLFLGGYDDKTLMDWATRPDVNIVERVDDEWRFVSPTWYPPEDVVSSESEKPGSSGSAHLDEE